MNKKSGQSNSSLLTAIIGVVGVIVGAALGYFGTQASAQAQIETAKINIYGPIYTTQTAEARLLSIPTLTPPLQVNQSSSGLSISISNLRVDGDVVGDTFEANNSRVGEFELVSQQDDNGYTSPISQLVYFWEFPGSYNELDNLPLRGIESIISISPSESRFEQEIIFCHYELYFDSHNYTSAEQFIPFDQPVTLVWDFTGRSEISEFDLSDEEKVILYQASDILAAKGISFTYYFKRNSELWQWQKLAYDVYDPSKVEKLSMVCNVSATQDFHGKEPGKQFVFRGTVTFGDIKVYPYEQPK